MQIGPWNLLKLILNLYNVLLSKGVLSVQETKDALKASMGDNINESERQRIVDGMIISKN